MKKFYLVQNMMYDAKHVIKHRWFHRVFGSTSLTVDSTMAYSRNGAEKLFRERGHDFGYFD